MLGKNNTGSETDRSTLKEIESDRDPIVPTPVFNNYDNRDIAFDKTNHFWSRLRLKLRQYIKSLKYKYDK
jgi:hypothetical protein